ncbi:hypothetical protein LOC67_09130 [Stieleria sp. JC731]|uniref:hypothetical protein n=1 Tax=Pirellulaceae TaxID=2691357 RepID=UPI001E41F7F0|nr:hypothetical protein [Stieleria sp. JC731]MCC9600725.1 hypothetical protein [Stieleria sp. JC731]
MAYTYSMTSVNRGAISPLVGFMFVHGWEINAAGIARQLLGGTKPNEYGYLLAAVNCESDKSIVIPANRSNPGWGDMTLTMNESGGGATFHGIEYLWGTNGEFANERGIGILLFQFTGIELTGWREIQSAKWLGGFPTTATTKPNLGSSFSEGVAPAKTVDSIYHPRYFDNSTGTYAASISRGFLNNAIHALISGAGVPTNWNLLGDDVTPGHGIGGSFHMVNQGCFKSLGWWDFEDISEFVTNPDVVGLRKHIVRTVGLYGKHPRNLENVDRHDVHNINVSDDPSVETLYIKLR